MLVNARPLVNPDRQSASNERIAAAAYIADLSSSLSALARRESLTSLAYLLDLARLEAETISRKVAKSTATASPPDSEDS
jgi:hypothetical protein